MLNTSVCLWFEVADRDHVVSLSCVVCSQFQSKLVGMHNYRASFIDGTSNVRTSSFKEHASTDMHVRAWCLTNSLSVRTKCTLTGHSVWTLPKNYFKHCWDQVTFDRPQAVFLTELCETSAIGWADFLIRALLTGLQ